MISNEDCSCWYSKSNVTRLDRSKFEGSTQVVGRMHHDPVQLVHMELWCKKDGWSSHMHKWPPFSEISGYIKVLFKNKINNSASAATAWRVSNSCLTVTLSGWPDAGLLPPPGKPTHPSNKADLKEHVHPFLVCYEPSNLNQKIVDCCSKSQWNVLIRDTPASFVRILTKYVFEGRLHQLLKCWSGWLWWTCRAWWSS